MKTRTSKLTWRSFKLAATEYLPDNYEYEVLIMHGAGSADQTKTKGLALALAELGCRVIIFDFVSHGLSTGLVSDLTLANRAEQALAVHSHFGLNPKSILVGYSMGGQTALDLMTLLDGQTACLALFAPALYDKAARQAHFGPDFSEIIRKEESWRHSDAWEKLGHFKNSLITFESPNDTVIPVAVIDLLHESASHSTQALRIRVHNAPHNMALWTTESHARAEWFADAVLRSAKGLHVLNTTQARQAGIEFNAV